MFKRTLPLAALVAAFLAWPAEAQRTGVTITTFANLPATCVPGQPFVVSDANATCTAGAGSARWCLCNATGNGYIVDPAGAPGADSIGTSELNDGADTPSTSQIVAVDSGSSAQFEYLALGDGLTNDGDNLNLSGNFTSAQHDHSNAAGGGDVALGAGSTGTTATKGDNDTSVATTAFVQTAVKLGSWSWNAFDVYPDGTRCKPASAPQVNSGPIVGAIDCDDNASSIIYFDTLDELYSGGTLVVTVQAINENATPSGDLEFDISAQCRGDSDTVDATWGTAQPATMTFTTQFDLEHADTAAITPNGTCVAGDTVFFRAVLDATATTTTQMADVLVVGFSAREQ